MSDEPEPDSAIGRELTDAENRLHRLLQARQRAEPEEEAVLAHLIEELGREMDSLRAVANSVR